MPPQAKHPGDVAGRQAGGIGRDDVKQVFDRPRHEEERAAVVVVGLGVADREAGDFAPGAVVVGVAVEAVPVGQRGESALERQDGKPVAGQVELADDLRAHQAHHVREHAVAEAREDLFGDGGAADERSRLQHADIQTGTRQVGRMDEAVVAAADYDDVVLLRHRDRRREGAGGRGAPPGFRNRQSLVKSFTSRAIMRRPGVTQRMATTFTALSPASWPDRRTAS